MLRAWRLLALALVLLAPRVAVGQEAAPTPAPTTQDRELDDWLLVEAGELPLVLAAPHGGRVRPAGWPVRTSGVLVRDTNTLEMAIALRESIRRRTGRAPFLVAARVDRRHLDLNRNEEQSGAQLGEAQQALWSAYHQAIEQACLQAKQCGGGQALFLDLHGHGHEHGLIELGYGVSAQALRVPDIELDQAEWIRGRDSLGAHLDRLGWPSVPSQMRPAPEPTQKYFSGGYTVLRHRREGLRSVQIELPPEPRRRQAALRQALVDGLADAILRWMVAHEALSPEQPTRVPTSSAVVHHPQTEPWQTVHRTSLQMYASALPWTVHVGGRVILATDEVSAEQHLRLAQLVGKLLDENQDGVLDDWRSWSGAAIDRPWIGVTLGGRIPVIQGPVISLDPLGSEAELAERLVRAVSR